MNVKELLKDINILSVSGMLAESAEVKAVAADSRTVGEGALFVAVRGPLNDGHCFIKNVLEKRPVAVIVEDKNFLPEGASVVPFILVRDSKEALARLSSSFFGDPAGRIRSVGITGTNGKTTSSYLIRSVLGEAGFKCAIIGTIGNKITDANIPSRNTTPGTVELYQLLKEICDAGNQYVAMEVSSHALDQDRVRGMVFSSAVFTNLTQDHLDYHNDMETYFRSKEKLFFNYCNRDSHQIVNVDDVFGSRLFHKLGGKKIGFGFSDCDVCVLKHEATKNATRATIKTPKGRLEIETSLIGRHNLYNILSTVSFAVMENINLDVVRRGIEHLRSVPGRLDRVDSKKGYSVFVDYAHTDDALKNVLESLRELVHNGRIITVFGCGGDRDRGKRPKMGQIASALSDHVLVTSDNPRSEDPREIIAQVVSGIPLKNFEIEPDRREAIHKALRMAREGDFVLVAGKGHETYQAVKDRIFPFDDKAVVLEAMS